VLDTNPRSSAIGRTHRLDALYRAYAGDVSSRCRRLLRESSAAEDATHETFLKAHRYLDRAPEGPCVAHWLHRIATNLCLNELRRRRLASATIDFEQDDSRAVDETAAAREQMQALMRQYPVRVIHAIWLTHGIGMGQGEAAQALGISRRTVVKYLRQVRVELGCSDG
jgi:RNA polymerase sigma-70 factor, ECF subfamily